MFCKPNHDATGQLTKTLLVVSLGSSSLDERKGESLMLLLAALVTKEAALREGGLSGHPPYKARGVPGTVGIHARISPRCLGGRKGDPIISPSQQASDLQLVQRLVEVLRKIPSGRDGNTLLPVLHPHSSALSFKPANECTIIPGIGLSDVPPNVGFEIHIVHHDIPAQTAFDLGACQIQERALTGLEDLDFGYKQREELMDRLHRLLEDSYTDGFSVPKELVQNADDACASRVSFLLDERENVDCRTNLITDAMASLQGPAIWVYNDAMFSPADFRNITRLGAETKKDDASKVGKFELGFNAMYNLTDVPFFISGHVLAMFDPQVRYLRKGAGLKLDFSKPINKALLSSMPQQFQPFHNIFGCSLRGPDVDYKGTLFRFPLRTPEQAGDNKLKSDSYSESKRRDFLQMMLEKAGSLLLFSQNVQEIEVFHLPRNCADVTNPTRLLTVRKTCSAALVRPSEVSLNEQTNLRFVKDPWLRQTDIRVQQMLQVEMAVTAVASKVCGVAPTCSVTQWHMAWASGIEQSARKALERSEEGLVPLAAAAVSFSDAGLIPLRDSPLGFYTTGHLFCFLPLPQSPDVAEAMLPVHLKATFALTSSRRGLKVQTEDELKSEGSLWNTALYSDAVCRAYLLLLQQVRQEAAQNRQFGRFFHLWPTGGLPYLVNSFYRHLETDGDPVLPVSGHDNTWVSFNQALRERGVDRSAQAVEGFRLPCGCTSTPLPTDEGQLLPQGVREETEERHGLIHHAVMRNDEDLDQLIRGHACIPCQGGRLLRKPDELVSPKERAAKLFLMSEQRFPQAAAAAQESTETAGAQESTETAGGEPAEIIVDFCSKTTRQRLSKLGMVIMPAYITALQCAKDLLFAERGQTHSRASALEQYHGLFPRRQGDPLWDEMVQQLYRAIAEEELLLFPMMCSHTQRLQWLPAVKKEGFPGYFNTLPNIYSQEQEHSRSVVLTGGLSTLSGRPSAPSPQDAAREM
ncbi:hypothetical protein ACOMHN_056659 [Nucella lapillus]